MCVDLNLDYKGNEGRGLMEIKGRIGMVILTVFFLWIDFTIGVYAVINGNIGMVAISIFVLMVAILMVVFLWRE